MSWNTSKTLYKMCNDKKCTIISEYLEGKDPELTTAAIEFIKSVETEGNYVIETKKIKNKPKDFLYIDMTMWTFLLENCEDVAVIAIKAPPARKSKADLEADVHAEFEEKRNPATPTEAPRQPTHDEVERW